MLTYELAKQLKDAGWPQPSETDDFEGGIVYWPDERPAPDEFWENGMPFYYSPSLEELIEACPQYMMLWGNMTPFRLARELTLEWSAGYHWCQNEHLPPYIYVKGATPTETLAHLWLEIKKREPEGSPC